MNGTTEVAPGRGWATRTNNGPQLMAVFQDGLPVRLIATPRSEFRTCWIGEPIADVVERNQEGFDYLPVIDVSGGARERILGLVELVPFLHGREPWD